MKKVVNVEEMRALEENAIKNLGIPSMVLMERAALSVFQELKKYISTGEERILVLCGRGNNGADGLALCRMAVLADYHVFVCLVSESGFFTLQLKKRETFPEADFPLEKLFPEGKAHMTEEFFAQLSTLFRLCEITIKDSDFSEYNIFVDALFGIGLNREISGTYYDCLQAVNREAEKKGKKVLAVDIPSGVHGTLGKLPGIGLKADCTVTFGWTKTGMLRYPGSEYAGRIVTADIGIPEDGRVLSDASWAFMEPDDLTSLKRRNPDSHKGSYGRALVIAGSRGMCGAAILSGKAALRTGCGILTVLSTQDNRIPLQTALPEALFLDRSEAEDAIKRADCLLIGPGLGTDEEASELVRMALLSGKPMVADADALNCISRSEPLKEELREGVVITPHMGEFARLTGADMSLLKTNRVPMAEDFARKYHVICVLKDARTIITDGKTLRRVNICGNPGMATGGSGDVLSGIILGLLATGETPCRGASLGVLIHALAGDQAKQALGERALLASDIIAHLPDVLLEAEKAPSL